MSTKLFQTHGDHIEAIMPTSVFMKDYLQRVLSDSKVYRKVRTVVSTDEISSEKTDVVSLLYGQGNMGMLSLIAYSPQKESNIFMSTYPLLKGKSIRVIIDDVLEWDNGIGATICCSVGDFRFAFFAIDYYENKKSYVAGDSLSMDVSALGCKVKEASRGFSFEGQQAVDWLAMAGLMMFGKGLSVQERFANFRMDYIDFCNLIGDERYSDRLTYDGRWENNLYQFFSRVIPKVTADIPRPFRMEGIQRVDDTPQHKAVREAFTNAIIHSDLLMDAGILRVEKHDDRLCFRNPGLLKLPIEMIYEGGNSKARNPRIQNMLRMIGYGENVGSGFPTIISAWKDAQWGEPELKNKIEVDEVELVLPTPNKRNGDANDKVNDSRNDRVNDSLYDRLNVSIRTTYTIISSNPGIQRKGISDISGKSIPTIDRHIAILMKEGLIEHRDSDKTGGYYAK